MQNNGDFLVGIFEDKLIAMGALRRTTAHRAEINRMRVHPDYQRRGFGLAILTALETRARELGYTELHLDTTLQQTAAQQLYDKNGYVLVRQGKIAGFDGLFYEKKLNSFPSMPPIERLYLRTHRLDLLPIHRDHAPSMFKVLNDTALYQFTGGSPPANVEDLTRRYEALEARTSPDGSELWFNWVLSLRPAGDLIGYVQASIGIEHADIAWIIGSEWQHQGYATEAAKVVVGFLLELGVREIRASIHPAHSASISVAERVGLRRTNERSGPELIWKLVSE